MGSEYLILTGTLYMGGVSLLAPSDANKTRYRNEANLSVGRALVNYKVHFIGPGIQDYRPAETLKVC